MNFHPVANIFPMMTNTELDQFAEDIRAHGLREPIWTYEGQIIDGRNRFRACERIGIEPSFREWEGGEDLVAFVVSLNLHRRHLTESQRGMVAARVTNLKAGDNQYSIEVGSIEPTISNKQAGEMLNVSRETVKRSRKVEGKGAPELVQAVEAGQVSVFAAATVADLPHEEQQAAVVGGKDSVRAAVKKVKEEKQKSKIEPDPIPGPVPDNDSKPEPQPEKKKRGKREPNPRDIMSPEFERAFNMFKDEILNSKLMGWQPTTKEAVLHHIEILYSISTIGG